METPQEVEEFIRSLPKGILAALESGDKEQYIDELDKLPGYEREAIISRMAELGVMEPPAEDG